METVPTIKKVFIFIILFLTRVYTSSWKNNNDPMITHWRTLQSRAESPMAPMISMSLGLHCRGLVCSLTAHCDCSVKEEQRWHPVEMNHPATILVTLMTTELCPTHVPESVSNRGQYENFHAIQIIRSRTKSLIVKFHYFISRNKTYFLCYK